MHIEPNITGPIALPDDAAALAGHVRRNPDAPYVDDHAPDLGVEEQPPAIEAHADGNALAPLVWTAVAAIVAVGIGWATWRYGLQGMAIAVVLVVFAALAVFAADD